MVEGQTLRIIREVPEGGLMMIVIYCLGTSGALGLIRMTDRSSNSSRLLGLQKHNPPGGIDGLVNPIIPVTNARHHSFLVSTKSAFFY